MVLKMVVSRTAGTTVSFLQFPGMLYCKICGAHAAGNSSWACCSPAVYKTPCTCHTIMIEEIVVKPHKSEAVFWPKVYEVHRVWGSSLSMDLGIHGLHPLQIPNP